MPTILLALDETDASHVAALTAAALFGPDANYLAVHAQAAPQGEPVVWGPVFAYPYPVTTLEPSPRDREQRRSIVDEARRRAAEQVGSLGIDATPVGEVGDPSEAIERVAAEQHAAVVVVGAHQRGWFRRLFEESVSKNLLDAGRVPVLVVPDPGDD